jgi:TPR repeat protein
MSRHLSFNKLRCLGVIVVTSLAFTAASSAAAGVEPLVIEFLPPAVDPKPVCVQRATDSDVVEAWTAWNGKALPKQDSWIIMREAQRLRDIDAAQYFPIVRRILDLLPTIDKKLTPENLEAERITLYLRAGKATELQASGLIEKLLARGEANAPKDLFLSAQLILNGVSAEQDKAKALSYLVLAAYGGNPDALLELAKRNLEGERIDGWQVDPSLAVTMAFGSMVGKLDPGICDRVARIAREYEKGEVVKSDPRIAERWRRFAADLGDGNAAWKVARYHLESADIDKDNELLLHYLQFAADHDVAAAQSELAHVYEVGAIVGKDLAKSELYYQKAAATGHRNSLIRLVNFYEDKSDAAAHAKYVDSLNALVAVPDPPGWVYSKLGDLVVDEKGTWSGEADAIPYYEKGAKLRDMSAMRKLAEMRFRRGSQDGGFDDGINLLLAVVDSFGQTEAMLDLRDAYLCRAPDGPQLDKAAYWTKATKDLVSGGWSAQSLEDLASDPDPATLAALQSEALYGQPNSVAAYLWYLKAARAKNDVIAEWQNRVTQRPEAQAAFANLWLKAAADDEARRQVLAFLLAAAEKGVSSAKLDAAEVIFTSFAHDPELVKQAEGYLLAEAQAGSGRAMDLLSTNALDAMSGADIYAKYAATIAARGDAEALIFAARQTNGTDERKSLLKRAGLTMKCSFEAALTLANAYASFGELKDARNWMTTAEALSAGKPWRLRILAEAYSGYANGSQQAEATRLFELAAMDGDVKAEQYLLKLYTDPKSPLYAPQKATETMVSVIKGASPDHIVATLARLDRTHKAIHDQVLARVDLALLYANAAEAGDPVGMRELGKLKLTLGRSAEARLAQDMFQKAAEAGDTEAMVLLAKNYAFGIGTEPSFASAKIWLERAAERDNREAKEMLAVMALKGG